MLVDTHAHLDFADFDDDRKEVINRALLKDIAIINVGSDFQASKRALDLARENKTIFACLGFHPHDASNFSQEVINTYRSLSQDAKVVGIGEVGLDYFRNLSPQEKQKEVFSVMLDLALELSLPAVIHCREAEEDTLAILKEKSLKRAVVHCFSSDNNFLNSVLGLDLFVSFTANITYKKADNLRELVKKVPQSRLMIETDCPFLAPQAVRGQRNEPAHIKYLVELIAELRNEKFEEVADYTTQNAKEFFNLKI